MDAGRHGFGCIGPRGRLAALCLPWLLALAATGFPVLAASAEARPAGGETGARFLHYWTGAMSGGIDSLVKAHNARYPDAPVKVSGLEHESFKGSILALLAGGNAPEIFSYWAGARTRALVGAGRLEPIDDLWASRGLDWLFTPAVAEACTYSGRKYAVPVTQHYVAFFYDKKLFARLGIAVPRDWDSFLRACEAISSAGVTPLAVGTRERWPAQFWFDYLLLRTAGHEYRTRLMAGQASYEDPQVVRAFTMWRDLVRRGYFNELHHSMDWADAARMVRNGGAAMTLMGTWIIGLYEGQLGWKQEEDFDFFAFPVVDPAVPRAALGPIDVLVLAQGKGGEGAKCALSFFAEAEPQLAMSQGSGALAPNVTVPAASYGGVQRRILSDIQSASSWAFNYDLATPPEVADIGLGCFAAFMKNPSLMENILAATQRKASVAFARSGKR